MDQLRDSGVHGVMWGLSVRISYVPLRATVTTTLVLDVVSGPHFRVNKPRICYEV